MMEFRSYYSCRFNCLECGIADYPSLKIHWRIKYALVNASNCVAENFARERCSCDIKKFVRHLDSLYQDKVIEAS